MRGVGVSETSREAFHTLPNLHLQAKEAVIMAIFGVNTRLSRQQISEITRMPLNGVCGRVDSLLTKGALIEEGERRDPFTGKRQKLLRLPIGQRELLF
jgi:hypothetical protein